MEIVLKIMVDQLTLGARLTRKTEFLACARGVERVHLLFSSTVQSVLWNYSYLEQMEKREVLEEKELL